MPGGLELHAALLVGDDRALAVDGVAEAVDDATEQALANGRLEDLAGAAHQAALADRRRLAHDGDADVVLFEVQHEAGDVLVARFELDQLAGQGLVEAVDARDAVTRGQHGAGLGDVDLAIVVADLALQDVCDLAGLDVHENARSLFGRDAGMDVGRAARGGGSRLRA